MSSSPPVVCQRIAGGLGNQLFQAAAAMSLARRLGATLQFDIRRFDVLAGRHFELGRFPTGATIWTPAGWRIPPGSQLADAVLRGRRPRWGWPGAVYRQPDYGFDPAFERLEGSVYLDGLFQSPLFFSADEDHIRRVFDCSRVAGDRARGLGAGWAGADRTSVHIRRGDYASNPAVLLSKGLMDNAYYERCIAVIRQIAPHTRLTIFSDDAAVAADFAARYENAEVVSGDSALDDLYLISRCRHHINANSTFSWWGAWLGPGGVTLAPRRHFPRERLKRTSIEDLYPVGWLLI